MTLLELQSVLGERIEVTKDNELKDEERMLENGKSEMIASLAKQMISNASVILRSDKLLAEGKISKETNISKLVGGKGDLQQKIHTKGR